MSKMAEYARIFGTGTSDEWVEKRKSAAADLESWLNALSPDGAIKTASTVAASLSGKSPLSDEVAAVGEEIIQKHASSFIRSAEEGELQITVLMSAAAIDVIGTADPSSRWTTPDALAAAFWSALSFQHPVEQIKIERLRQDLLVASRTRVLNVAEASRERRPIPPIGMVNIDQDSTPGAKVNTAFSRAVEPMVTAMRDNAALDREELDFMWWLLSDRSDMLGEPFAGMPSAVRAVVAGLDAAAKLRKLPSDAHCHIVLSKVMDGERLSLAELVRQLDERRVPLAEKLRGPSLDAPAVFPLITAIVDAGSDAPFAGEKLAPSEWGARALLEGSIRHLRTGTAGGL